MKGRGEEGGEARGQIAYGAGTTGRTVTLKRGLVEVWSREGHDLTSVKMELSGRSVVGS